MDSRWAGTTVPLHDYVGMEIAMGPPVVVTVPLGEHVRGAYNHLHGGIAAVLADVACAAAVAGQLRPDDGTPVTTDLHVRYLGQPRTSPVTATAEVVHRSSRTMVSECVIADADGRTVARVDASFMLVDRPPVVHPTT